MTLLDLTLDAENREAVKEMLRDCLENLLCDLAPGTRIKVGRETRRFACGGTMRPCHEYTAIIIMPEAAGSLDA